VSFSNKNLNNSVLFLGLGEGIISVILNVFGINFFPYFMLILIHKKYFEIGIKPFYDSVLSEEQTRKTTRLR